MIEYVYRPSRRVKGKRVVAESFSGRYSLAKGERTVTVSLHTPDRQVAEKRLRAIVVEKQREREGIISPKSERVAAGRSLLDLLGDYEADLVSRSLSVGHIRDTVWRLKRMLKETNWKRLYDIKPDEFLVFRSGLGCSPKTKNEYHVSVNAFLNWLVKCELVARNPLERLDMIDTRGKEVRRRRALSQDEVMRLLGASARRRLVYLTLVLTGQRKTEVRNLVLSDLHLVGDRPYVLFRSETTKDKEKRPVALHPALRDALRAFVGSDAEKHRLTPTARVFARVFPDYKTLRRDLVVAGIEHKDGLGRVVDFHSLRKTFQTLGVNFGVNQRVAQEVLGHSDANLTAKAYTDVPSLEMHAEIAKLPSFLCVKMDDAHPDAQKAPKSAEIAALVEQAKTFATNALSWVKSLQAGASKMVDLTGLEPVWSGRLKRRLGRICAELTGLHAHLDAQTLQGSGAKGAPVRQDGVPPADALGGFSDREPVRWDKAKEARA